MSKRIWRGSEALMLITITIVAAVGLFVVAAAEQYRQGQTPQVKAFSVALPVLIIMLPYLALHTLLSIKKILHEQAILPITGMLFVLGVTMIWRLRGWEGGMQQITRGLIPGVFFAGLLITRPAIVEKLRRRSVWVGLCGLLLLLFTGLFGVEDETGSRLALKFGPLPSVQTSEIIKLSLIIFLAWYIEREGRAAEGRAHSLLWFRLPAFRYMAPAAAFIGAATLSLVAMADYGAVIILVCLFVSMLYVGFDTRVFLTISALGISMAVVMGIILSQTWELPMTIQYRFLAFLNPWSIQVIPGGLTIAEGPGYQIQQAIYAIIAGGITGTGVGLGSPTFIPLAHSDFILAAIFEEMGSAVGIAVLVLYTVLFLRIFRLVILIPPAQVFERMLLTGIGVHFFTQVFVMAGGTLNVLPLTGVTLPFLSMGGMALMVNLTEIGLILALVQRIPAALGKDVSQ